MLIKYAKVSTAVFFECMQETQRLKAEPVPGIEATPDESNARYFHVIVVGPKDVRFPCFIVFHLLF